MDVLNFFFFFLIYKKINYNWERHGKIEPVHEDTKTTLNNSFIFHAIIYKKQKNNNSYFIFIAIKPKNIFLLS